MKHIIIEGLDCIGKNALIKKIADYYNYENLTIRHFGKPPKFTQGKDILSYQIDCFNAEILLLNSIYQLELGSHSYYENTVIWNRSFHGEYVHGHLHRQYDKSKLLNEISILEKKLTSNTYFFVFYSSPDFAMKKEDGHSFSKNLEQKNNEIYLFHEIFDQSIIANKKIINVEENGYFKTKETIFQESLKLIQK